MSFSTPATPVWQRLLGWLISLLLPVVLVLITVRLLFNPLYVEFEYRTPGFPADRYGFTLEDRLYYSKLTIEYLVTDAEISFLEELRFPEGQQIPPESCQFVDDCTQVFNDRELGHMLDVKRVTVAAFWTLRVGLVALVGLMLLAWRGGWLDEARRALQRGGRLTVILTAAVLVFVLVGFSIIFVAFHEVFFPPGTWTFYYSDTLIRLTPERFWRDAFLYVAGLPALLGWLIGWVWKPAR